MSPKQNNKIKKAFTLDWYKELGWNSNPFTTENLEPVDYFISGYEAEMQRLNYFIIEAYSFGTIKGALGMGKSLLLNWLGYELQKYRNRYHIALIPCEKIKEKEFTRHIIESLLGIHEQVLIYSWYKTGINKLADYIAARVNKKYQATDSLYQRIAAGDFSNQNLILEYIIMKTKKQPLILLLDDASSLPKECFTRLDILYKRKIPLQIIITGSVDQIKRIDIQQKDSLHIELKPLNYPSVRAMIKKRIEFFGGHDIEPFNDAQLANFFAQSNKNQRSMLDTCYDKAVKIALKRIKEKPLSTKLPALETVPTIFPAQKVELPSHANEPVQSSDYKIKVIDRSTEPFNLKLVPQERTDYIVKEIHKDKQQNTKTKQTQNKRN